MTSIGKVTKRSVSITKRALGGRAAPNVADIGAVGSTAAACSAVESRETKMEPTLPGRPVPTRVSTRRHEGDGGARTTDDDGEECEAIVSTDKQVEHDARPAADRHRAE